MVKPEISHYIYLLQCADGTYYCGYTTDLARRVAEHNSSGRKGASYTRSRRPVVLQYYEQLPTRSAALQREYQIKQLSRIEKRHLVQTFAIMKV